MYNSAIIEVVRPFAREEMGGESFCIERKSIR